MFHHKHALLSFRAFCRFFLLCFSLPGLACGSTRRVETIVVNSVPLCSDSLLETNHQKRTGRPQRRSSPLYQSSPLLSFSLVFLSCLFSSLSLFLSFHSGIASNARSVSHLFGYFCHPKEHTRQILLLLFSFRLSLLTLGFSFFLIALFILFVCSLLPLALFLSLTLLRFSC